MKEKKMMIAAVCAIALLSMIAAVAAEPAYDAQRGVISINDTKDWQGPSVITAYGGNISTMDISVELSTLYWVGFVGNVTHSIVLEGAGNNTFYDWGSQNSDGAVMFSNSSNVDFASLTDGLNGHLVTENSFLGLGTRADNLTSTFTLTNAAQFEIGAYTAAPGSVVSLNTSSNGGNDWETAVVYDGVNLVYVGDLQNANEDYRGTPVDYQVMLPVAQATSSRVYYVYAAIQ